MDEQNNTFSMTPPLSPMELEFLDEDYFDDIPTELLMQQPEEPESPQETGTKFPICFVCSGEMNMNNRSLTKEGYVASGYFDRVLNSSFVFSTEFQPQTVELLGYIFPTQYIDNDEVTNLFLLARQWINRMTRLCADSYTISSSTADVFGMRQQIQIFFEFIRFYVKRICQEEIKNRDREQCQELELIVNHLCALVGHVGRLTESVPVVTPNTVTFFGNKSRNSSYHVFHMHLDIYWSVISILNLLYSWLPDLQFNRTISRNCLDDEERAASSLLEQVLSSTLWDLISMASQMFEQLPFGDYIAKTPYLCPCVKELWLMLFHLFEKNYSLSKGESFWVTFHNIIQMPDFEHDKEIECDSDVFLNPLKLTHKNKLGFPLWLLVHVANLTAYNTKGELIEEKKILSNYHDLENIVKKIFVVDMENEKGLRCYLKCVLNVSKLWEPSVTILMPLWDYYFRRLNNTFHLSGSSMDGYASESKTALDLLEQCKKWSSQNEQGIDQENSYKLFLRVLSLQLSKLIKCNQHQEWKKMKGRIFSKFHQRRMQELNGVGLINFTYLFLTLCLTSELEDVASKMCDFFDMLDFTSINVGKRSVIWKGGFGLIMIYSGRKMDISFIADKMVNSFNTVCREIAEPGLDSNKCRDIWKLLCLYLDSVQELLETSSCFRYSEYKLIGEGLEKLLPACGENELRRCLSVLQMIKSRIRQVYKTDCDKSNFNFSKNGALEMSRSLWIHVYPFIKSHSSTLTPPISLADLAAEFCLSALEMSKETIGPTETFQNVFQFFSLGENVNIRICCRFLCQVLAEENTSAELSKLKNYDVQIVRLWFRCAVQIPPSSENLVSLTKVIVQSPVIQEIFKKADIPADFDDTNLMHRQFMKALCKMNTCTTGWKEKIELREKVMEYFTLIPKQISGVLKSVSPPESVTTVFSVFGHLIKYCSQMLFVESKTDCPLPKIIDTMIAPHYMFSLDRPVNPIILNCIKDTLHLFVQGLSRLDYKRIPYVQRRLKDIFNIYLHRFPIKSSNPTSLTVSVHPLVSCLSHSFSRNPLPESIAFRHFILEQIMILHMNVKNFNIPASGNMGLSYITEVLQRTTNAEVIARDCPILLRPALDYHFISENKAIRQHAVHLIQYLMDAWKKHPETVQSDRVLLSVKDFVTTYFKYKYSGVVDTLEKVAILNPDFVALLIPQLTKSVEELEMKRGAGKDMKMRDTYTTLLNMLGTAGNEEIMKLQTT